MTAPGSPMTKASITPKKPNHLFIAINIKMNIKIPEPIQSVYPIILPIILIFFPPSIIKIIVSLYPTQYNETISLLTEIEVQIIIMLRLDRERIYTMAGV